MKRMLLYLALLFFTCPDISHYEFCSYPFINGYPPHHARSIKPWTFMVYISGDNDLKNFIRNNLDQAASLGSTPYVNVLAFLNTKTSKGEKVTYKLFIAHRKIYVIEKYSQWRDGGAPETLQEALRFAKEDFPAEHYAICFWNHGTGDLSPHGYRIRNTEGLFFYDTQTSLITLDRTIPFIEYIENQRYSPKGLCFDDTTGSFLTDADLAEVFIAEDFKVDVVLFDTCLTAMTGMMSAAKEFADYAVASQEVVLGLGYDYNSILSIFKYQSPSPENFACHIVAAYARAYGAILADYTQSAMNLKEANSLIEQISTLAKLLTDGLMNDFDESIHTCIKRAASRQRCTHFDEPSYIDLHHFCRNLLLEMPRMKIRSGDEQSYKNEIKQIVASIIRTIDTMIIANATGKKVPNARGISIYFPTRYIHPSYYSSAFVKESREWLAFLQAYLASGS